MKKFNFSLVKLFLLTAFVAGALSLTSCNFGNDNPVDVGLTGTWVSSFGEVFTITEDSFSNGGSWGDTYAGNNLVVIKDSDTAGTIFFKYTKAMNPDFTYSETAPDVGKWYAVSYKDLSSKSVSLAGAYKADGKTSTDTLKEAKAEFTIENGYFSFYSECTK